MFFSYLPENDSTLLFADSVVVVFIVVVVIFVARASEMTGSDGRRDSRVRGDRVGEIEIDVDPRFAQRFLRHTKRKFLSLSISRFPPPGN